jgi:hypothetical protein
MSRGAFAEWQPRYAEHGIATFPVHGKKPAVRGYLRLGLPASSKLTAKFENADAFGFALRPAGIAVVDVDTPDERVLVEALDHYGPTPIVVRSGSGHFQAWYRRQDEGRRIRPDPNRPVDVLGAGYVVAPPSAGPRRLYEIIQGTLADLDRLPVLQQLRPTVTAPAASVGQGARNDALWRHCMREARYCDDVDALLDVARTRNATFAPPLADAEVVKTAISAWDYTERGENWFGCGRRVITTHDEIDRLLQDHPDAFMLLMMLRRHHWGREFVVANEMAQHMPGGGWARKRFVAARRHLIEIGAIVPVQPARQHMPAVYRFQGGQN